MTRQEAEEMVELLLLSNRFDTATEFAITVVKYLQDRGVRFADTPNRNEIVDRNQAILEYLERKEKL